MREERKRGVGGSLVGVWFRAMLKLNEGQRICKDSVLSHQEDQGK